MVRKEVNTDYQRSLCLKAMSVNGIGYGLLFTFVQQMVERRSSLDVFVVGLAVGSSFALSRLLVAEELTRLRREG